MENYIPYGSRSRRQAKGQSYSVAIVFYVPTTMMMTSAADRLAAKFHFYLSVVSFHFLASLIKKTNLIRVY